MKSAKIRSMVVRPIHSADLAFNLAGIISFRHPSKAYHGVRISKPFDFETIYATLSDTDADGRFKNDATAILRTLKTDLDVALFMVRNQPVMAALTAAVATRQNAFLRRYQHSAKIVELYTDLYPPTTDARFPTSKLGRLDALRKRSAARHDLLHAQYVADHKDGVVVDTTTDTVGKSANATTITGDSTADTVGRTDTDAKSDTNSEGTEKSTQSQTSSGDATTKQLPLAYQSVNQISRYRDSDDVGQPVKTRIDTTDTSSRPTKWNGAGWEEVHAADASLVAQKMDTNSKADTSSSGESKSTAKSSSTSIATSTAKTTSTQNQVSDAKATFDQKSMTVLTEYRHPAAENDIRWLQRELELQDEGLAQTLFSFQVPTLDRILGNELVSIDQEVRQLQLNLIHTVLVSPISGVITSVYKDVGESVAAGEPVLRVEDDSEVLLIGIINCRALIRVGEPVTLELTNAFESGGQPIKLDGKLVVIRGHSSDNDEWEVIIRCDNTVAGDATARRLPLNYNFQKEDMTVQIG